MKKLGTWDSYVQEATSKEDRRVELPITAKEVYVLEYPTRAQGKKILAAQRVGDIDAMLVALLGEAAGTRIAELSDEQPGFVVDHFLVDVMRKFGMIPEDEADEDVMATVGAAAMSLVRDADDAPAEVAAPSAAAKAATPGKGSARRSSSNSRTATTRSSRSPAASS